MIKLPTSLTVSLFVAVIDRPHQGLSSILNRLSLKRRTHSKTVVRDGPWSPQTTTIRLLVLDKDSL